MLELSALKTWQVRLTIAETAARVSPEPPHKLVHIEWCADDFSKMSSRLFLHKEKKSSLYGPYLLAPARDQNLIRSHNVKAKTNKLDMTRAHDESMRVLCFTACAREGEGKGEGEGEGAGAGAINDDDSAKSKE